MEANLVWREDLTFVAEADSGHRVVVDGPPDLGGRNRGARPMELILMGLGGCAALDVVHILRKGHRTVSKCAARVTAHRAASEPKVFTDIHLHFTVAGENLSERKVARAIKLSAEKYCSASIMLRRSGAMVTHSFEIK